MFLLNQRAQKFCNLIGRSKMHHTVESHSFKYEVNKFTCILHRALSVTQSYIYLYLVTDFRVSDTRLIVMERWKVEVDVAMLSDLMPYL